MKDYQGFAKNKIERNIMKNVKGALESVEKIDEKYSQTGAIKQFTIDMIEHFGQELNDFILGETALSEEIVLGSLKYYLIRKYKP